LALDATRDVLRRAALTRAHIQPRPRRVALHRSHGARSGGHTRARRRKAGSSEDRRARHGVRTPTTPEDVEAYYTRIRHGRPPTPEQLLTWSFVTTRLAASPAGAQHGDRWRPSRDVSTNSLRPVRLRFGSKYEPPLIEDTPNSFAIGFHHGDRHRARAALVGHVNGQYMSRAAESLARTSPSSRGRVVACAGFLELIAGRVHEVLETYPANVTARPKSYSRPTRCREDSRDGRHLPRSVAESARHAASLAGVTRYDVACSQRVAPPTRGYPDILEVLPAKKKKASLTSCRAPLVSSRSFRSALRHHIAAQRVAHESDCTCIARGR